MSNITLTIIRHRGEALPLGRNVAVKLLLDKSAPQKTEHSNGAWSAARAFWAKSFPRPRAA
jgi:hypothetical protein